MLCFHDWASVLADLAGHPPSQRGLITQICMHILKQHVFYTWATFVPRPKRAMWLSIARPPFPGRK